MSNRIASIKETYKKGKWYYLIAAIALLTAPIIFVRGDKIFAAFALFHAISIAVFTYFRNLSEIKPEVDRFSIPIHLIYFGGFIFFAILFILY